MQFLLWLESIRNPALDFFMEAVTYLGDEIFFILMALTVFRSVDKEEGYYLILSGRKNSYSLFGALVGFAIAYPIEKKYIRFSEEGSFPAQVCKVLVGLVGILAVKEGLKALFSAMDLTWMGIHGFRYCAVVLFAALVWPLTFPFWDRILRKKA